MNKQEVDEPQKVKVPAFVAEWIETAKKEKRTLHYSMQDIDDACYYHKGDDPLYRWMFVCDDSSEHQEIFARVWLDGYEVEEEPKWVVKSNRLYFTGITQLIARDPITYNFTTDENRAHVFDDKESAEKEASFFDGTVEQVEV